MDSWRFQLINGRLVDAPTAEWFSVGNGTDARDPQIPNLPFGNLVPSALATPKPEIEVRSSNTVTYTSRTNTTYSAPAGLVDGDIIVIYHALFGTPPTPTPPSGFALYDDGAGPLIVTDGAYSGNLYLYWKRASSESGSYTVTHATSNSAGLIVAYKNCLESGTPFAEQSADNSGTTTLGIANSLVTTADRSRLIFMEMDVVGGGGLTAPDGMVERCDLELYIADQRIARSGETSATRRHTNGGTAWATRMVELLAAVGSGTTTGVGSASGTGTATGTGRSTARSPGSAAGIGTASAVGRSTARSVGAASGTGTATGVGRGIALAVGAAAGTGTATATGRSTARSAGAASGTGTASATGISTARSPGAAAGTGTAAGVGRSTARSVGAASGVGAAAGVASSGSAGAAAGTGTATGVGRSTARSVGAASGTGTAIGVILTFARSAGAASGTGTATGVAVGGAVGAASGTGTATGVIIAFARSVGAAAGVGDALGVGSSGAVVTDRPRAANDRRRRRPDPAEVEAWRRHREEREKELERRAAELLAQVREATPDDEPPPPVVAATVAVLQSPEEASNARIRRLDAILRRLNAELVRLGAAIDEEEDEETALMLLVA